MRLGNRADAFDDRLPVISLIITIENIAVGGAGEDGVTTVPHIHRHCFDVGSDMVGQATVQDVPILAAIAAARDACIGGVKFPPGAWPGLGAGDKQKIRILGMDEEWIDVADAEISWRHAFPARAAVAANTEACDRVGTAVGRRRGAVYLARIVGRH